MDSSDYVRHVRYNAWASARVLDSVSALSEAELTLDRGDSHRGIIGTLRHICDADAIWLARLQGKPAQGLIFAAPDTLEALRLRMLELLDSWVEWAEHVGPNGWDEKIDYRTTKGVPYQDAVSNIVLHLVNHDSYHRGQIAAMLRQAGKTPVTTDLIAYLRQR